MEQKRNIRMGLLSALVILCMVVTMMGDVAFATELPASEPSESDAAQETTLPATSEPPTSSETSEPTESTAPSEPEESVPETTVPSCDDSILLTWNVDSSLVYRLTGDNFAWQVYDAKGNVLPESGGTPASAGYVQTSLGKWYGSATIAMNIANHLDTAAELRLLFMNAFSEMASVLSSTIVADNEAVAYDSETGTLTIQPGGAGVVTMTITGELLQQAAVTITEEDNIAGWIQVQVISPSAPAQTETESIVVEPTLEQMEAPTDGQIEIPTQPEQEQNVA